MDTLCPYPGLMCPHLVPTSGIWKQARGSLGIVVCFSLKNIFVPVGRTPLTMLSHANSGKIVIFMQHLKNVLSRIALNVYTVVVRIHKLKFIVGRGIEN